MKPVIQVNDERQLQGLTTDGEEIAVAAVVKTLTLASIPKDQTTHVWIGVKLGAINVTFDGSDPAQDAAGLPFAAGATHTWSVARARQARFVRATSTSAVVRVEYARMSAAPRDVAP